MGAEIRIYSIGDSWTLLPGGHGFYVNNGNVNLYMQQQTGAAPEAADAGVRIRPGGSFLVSHDLHKITYLRTDGGTTTIAKYDDRNNGAGSTALVDPTSGNHAMINEAGQVHVVLRGDVDALDTPFIDAFSRLRVSNPYTVFDSKQLHDKSPLFWDETLGGSATSTHSAINARTRLEVTANAADFAIRQTKMRFNYQPAKSQMVFFTFYNEHVTGLIKRVGLFDGTGTNNLTPNNGIFFETNDGISWNIAKNGVAAEKVVQENWNVDTLDGSGDENNPSGLTLNDNAPQIGVLDFEWLGIGRVRVGFVINGLIVYVHKFNHANVTAFDSVYMSTPNLPLRYDIQSDGTAAGFIDHICSSVISEGGREDNGVIRYASTEGTHINANTENVVYALMGIRLKAAYKDISVKLVDAIMQIQTAGHKVEWILKLNPTVAGTFTYADQTDSAVQIALGATANTVTGGYNITGGLFGSGGQELSSAGSGGKALDNAILLGSKIDGTLDTIVLCARPIAGSTHVNIEAALTWRELL